MKNSAFIATLSKVTARLTKQYAGIWIKGEKVDARITRWTTLKGSSYKVDFYKSGSLLWIKSTDRIHTIKEVRKIIKDLLTA